MQIESMRDFLLFSRYMNFSRAAKMLNVSQPTLSYRISQLEKELGFKLLDRTPRPRLTAAGKEFVRHAEAIVGQYDDMMAACRGIACNDGGTIVFERPVCFERTWREVEQLCHEFTAASNTNVRFAKTDASLLEAVETGQVDVGFVWSLPDFVEEESGLLGYTLLPISDHPEVRFYMRRENPLAKKDLIDLEDLEGAKVVLPLSIRYAVFDETAERFIRQGGINLKIVHKSGTYRDIELGLGKDEIAFSMEDLGDHAALEARHGLVSRKAAGDSWVSKPYLVYRIDNDNPALESLLGYVESLHA